MISVAGGLAAAMLWTIATITSVVIGRRVGAMLALAWVNVLLVGVAAAAALVVTGAPQSVPAGDFAWAVVFGFSYSAAMVCVFQALATGHIGLGTTVLSTEGAIAALIGVALGESIAVSTSIALAVVVVGVALSATETSGSGLRAVRGRNGRALLFAVGGAFAFGMTLVAGARAGHLGALWTISVGRLVGVLLVSAPVLIRVRLRRPTGVWLLIAVNGVCDLLGFVAFVAAAHHGVAVPAVLGSQYATMTVIVGVVAFRERLRAWQWAGVFLTLVGTAVIAATHH